MSIIASIREYLAACPSLSGKKININYLSPEIDSFAIDSVAREPVVKRYVSGETVRQYCFLLAGRIAYDGNLAENASVSGFFEELEAWLEAQNSAGNFPAISGGVPLALEIVKSGAIKDTARTSARVEIELRLLYKRND